jgi:hypothetical protein
MAQHDDDGFNTTPAQIVDAGFDDGFVSEGKKRLESAHAAGLTGGEKNCSTRFHMIIL